jgi:hypothetical protein
MESGGVKAGLATVMGTAENRGNIQVSATLAERGSVTQRLEQGTHNPLTTRQNTAVLPSESANVEKSCAGPCAIPASDPETDALLDLLAKLSAKQRKQLLALVLLMIH